MASLTVIFPYRDRDMQRAKRSLVSLQEQLPMDGLKIILVDYGSSPSYRDQIKNLLTEFPAVRYVYNDTFGMPWNRSHALNTGIRLADTDFVFTADIDIMFDKNFFKFLNESAQPETAEFFSVGYLNEKFGFNREIRKQDYVKSKTFALGMALLPVNVLQKIGGYNEFYCYWGVEDNDMEHRLRHSGINCRFHDEPVFLFHQWHPPAYSGLPQGWRTCMGEYFEKHRLSAERNIDKEWGRVLNDKSRPSLKALTLQASSLDELTCRKEYLQWYLVRQFHQLKSGETFAGRFRDAYSEKYLQATPGKLASLLQRTADAFQIPLDFRSSYSNQYCTVQQARDVFFYFIKSNEFQLSDFCYFENDGFFDFAFTRN